MRMLKRLPVCIIVAFAGLALASQTASATPVELMDEPGTVHCNPCTETESGFATLESHIFGSEQIISACEITLDGEGYEDGSGSAHNQVFSGEDCTRQACDSAAETEWTTTSAMTETGPGAVAMDVEFCIEPSGGGGSELHCVITVTGTRHSAHSGEGEMHGDCGSNAEVDGHRDVSGGEIIHL